MTRPAFQRARCIACLSVWIVSVLGCGSGGKSYVTGTVSGRITLDGAPIKQGCVVVFHPADGDGNILGTGLINPDGTYFIYRETDSGVPGVPIGKYKVTVSPPPLPPDERKDVDEKNQTAIMSALMNRDAAALKKNVIVPQTDIVPQRYWSQGTSPLEIAVKEGLNSGNFELEPEPPKE